MNWHAEDILSIFDRCCERFTFPMLDNGYVYLAASRLSLYRSADDWAMVIEIFGFSPRSGLPDIQVYTIGSRLRRAKSVDQFVTRLAYESYLEENEHNESTFIYPVEEGDWMDREEPELMAPGPSTVILRGNPVRTSPLEAYAEHGISLQDPPQVHVFEFCRMLADTSRDAVLASADERRECVPPELEQVLQLEEWNHPDLSSGACASANACFRSLANILAGEDASSYQPPQEPNTHWRNWPEGGTL